MLSTRHFKLYNTLLPIGHFPQMKTIGSVIDIKHQDRLKVFYSQLIILLCTTREFQKIVPKGISRDHLHSPASQSIDSTYVIPSSCFALCADTAMERNAIFISSKSQESWRQATLEAVQHTTEWRKTLLKSRISHAKHRRSEI